MASTVAKLVGSAVSHSLPTVMAITIRLSHRWYVRTREVSAEVGQMKTKKKLPNDLIGVSGVHFVVSELSRRGLIALPTVKNCAAYDIIATNPTGTKHANLQVKTSFGTRDFWPISASKKIRSGPHDYYIFLRWLGPEERYQGYLVQGREVKLRVKRAEAETKRKGQRQFPAFFVGKRSKGRDAHWAKQWSRWAL